jgi:hypothetical protein
VWPGFVWFTAATSVRLRENTVKLHAVVRWREFLTSWATVRFSSMTDPWSWSVSLTVYKESLVIKKKCKVLKCFKEIPIR